MKKIYATYELYTYTYELYTYELYTYTYELYTYELYKLLNNACCNSMSSSRGLFPP